MFEDIFNKTYLDILNENETADGYFEINKKPIPIYLNSFKIINEYVKNPNLAQVPKEFFIEIVKNLKINKNDIFKISYEKIYNLLNRHDYEFSEEFKENLMRYNDFNGFLYIAILENNLKIYHDFLDDVFDFIKVDELFEKSKNSSGITDSWSRDLSSKEVINKNVLIVINRNFIKNSYSWKDTLEHELTHFIKRIVGYDKSLIRNFKYLNNDAIVSNEKLNDFVNDIISKTTLDKNECRAGLYRFISYILQPQEHDENIKSFLNCIQRIYEFSFFNLEKRKIINKDLIENRMKFIDNFLKTYFIELLDKYLIKNKLFLNKFELVQYNTLFSLIIFKVYSIIGYDMKNILIEHFKNFKFRDI